MAKQYLCTECLTKAVPVKVTKGSFWIEIALWCCILVPGLIYSIWRLTSKYKACPACQSSHIIPLDSPRARQILEGKAA